MNRKTLIEKIDNVKTAINTAFSDGAIDFDAITSDLDDIRNEISSEIAGGKPRQTEIDIRRGSVPHPQIIIENYK